jgi:hypothetical protein
MDAKTIPEEEMSTAPKIHQLFYYAGHIIVSYKMYPDIDLFKVNGPLVDRIELDRFFKPSKMRIA